MRRLAGCSAESPREAALWRVEAQSLADAPYGTVPGRLLCLGHMGLRVEEMCVSHRGTRPSPVSTKPRQATQVPAVCIYLAHYWEATMSAGQQLVATMAGT